jgi:hypothetical protein
MNKSFKKGVLLFAAAMALGAFAMPSIASAASWGVVGSEHTLDGNLGFRSDVLGTSSDCARVQFTADVSSAANLEITHGTFFNCTLNGATTGLCTVTARGTNFPWTATAVTTSSVQIHGVDIDVGLENHPGGSACTASGVQIRITGTLSGARWTGNALHDLDIDGSTGLVSHSPFGNGAVITPTGTIFDTQNTLVIN